MVPWLSTWVPKIRPLYSFDPVVKVARVARVVEVVRVASVVEVVRVDEVIGVVELVEVVKKLNVPRTRRRTRRV